MAGSVSTAGVILASCTLTRDLRMFALAILSFPYTSWPMGSDRSRDADPDSPFVAGGALTIPVSTDDKGVVLGAAFTTALGAQPERALRRDGAGRSLAT